jgi:hypothetical protein
VSAARSDVLVFRFDSRVRSERREARFSTRAVCLLRGAVDFAFSEPEVRIGNDGSAVDLSVF